ncbi:MAG: glycosyltransferase [Deltaproteobacteria bacterium]|nr:glycosyltransferase [Deltaproteobacteria bacterium]
MKIAIVYTKNPLATMTAMDIIRWVSLSTALARLGIEIDMVTVQNVTSLVIAKGVRVIPVNNATWSEYAIVKACYQRTINHIPDHPRIIVRLARVVGVNDSFRDYAHKDELLECQSRISAKARAIIVNDVLNKKRWIQRYGTRQKVFTVPNACPAVIPTARLDNKNKKHPVALFTGSLSSVKMVEMLNNTGNLLRQKGWELVVAGANKTMFYCSNTHELDRNACTYLGPVSYEDSLRLMLDADVGLALAPSPHLHENETSKIYTYLRCGLPVVYEEKIPNANLVSHLQWGVIFKYDNSVAAAKATEVASELSRNVLNKNAVIRHMQNNETWDNRALLLKEIFNEVYSDET